MLLSLVAGIIGVASAPVPGGAASAPVPGPIDLPGFFAGRTRSDNDLKIIFHRPTRLIVDGFGRRERNELIQTDTVHEGDKPVRTRVWRTHQIGPGHFGGTLTDATGPVDISIRGADVVIRYTMKGGLDIVETLQFGKDRKVIANHVVARKLGLTFAHVDGTITKLD